MPSDRPEGIDSIDSPNFSIENCSLWSENLEECPC